MGDDLTILAKISEYESAIKKIQSDLDGIFNNLETCDPGTAQYAAYHGQQWSLNQVLESKKRMLKKWKAAAKDNGLELQKQTLYDRNESKLIERICDLRKQYPHLKVGQIQRPFTSDEVYEVEIEN